MKPIKVGGCLCVRIEEGGQLAGLQAGVHGLVEEGGGASMQPIQGGGRGAVLRVQAGKCQAQKVCQQHNSRGGGLGEPSGKLG
jgi:hypothetical protein